VVAIDGVKAVTALTAYGDAFVGDGTDAASRFTAVVTRHRFMARSLEQDPYPTAATVTYSLRTAAAPGVITTASIAWIYLPTAANRIPVANLSRRCTPTPSPPTACPAAASLPAGRSAEGFARAAAVTDSAALASDSRPAGQRRSPLRLLVGGHRAEAPVHRFGGARRLAPDGEQDATAEAADTFADLPDEAVGALARRVGLTAMSPREWRRQRSHWNGHGAGELLGDGDVAASSTAAGPRRLQGGSSITIVYDESARWGVYLLFDSGLNALRLRLGTFLPQPISDCFRT
jgi:hypothetical protein